MSARNKILEQINKKAQKIREKRIEAANNKTIEAAAFEFFKNVEESRLLHEGKSYDYVLVSEARLALENRMRAFDSKVSVAIEYTAVDDGVFQNQQIRGVTIWWSQTYIQKNNVDPSLYIDVSQMLLF